ncbi:MAG: hypothetical protein HY040_28115 [Planctomycetes bacterium]|nr:hypothetical protein [Planctomycetota bacterium]
MASWKRWRKGTTTSSRVAFASAHGGSSSSLCRRCPRVGDGCRLANFFWKCFVFPQEKTAKIRLNPRTGVTASCSTSRLPVFSDLFDFREKLACPRPINKVKTLPPQPLTERVSMMRCRDNTYQPAVEHLENRILPAISPITATFASGILQVYGTDAADQITVRQVNGRISVDNLKITWNHAQVASVPASSVSDIQVFGKGGNDILRIDGSITKRAFVHGGAGNDTIYGGSGRNILYGDDGNDVIYGGAGADLIYGGNGNDKLYGRGGNDLIYGEAGDDYLSGDAGSDYLVGGAGNDSFRRNMLVAGQIKTEDRLADGPNVSTPGTDSYRAVDQQRSPTCVFLASLAATANWTGTHASLGTINNDLLSRISYDSGKDQYGVRLFVNGSWQTVWVSGDWNEALDPGGQLWVTLYQKAYLKAMGVTFQAADGSYLSVDQWHSTTGKPWQNTANALTALTGQKATFMPTSGALPADLRRLIQAGKKMVANTNLTVESRIVADHAYMVMDVYQDSGGWKLRLYNPWGHDGPLASTDGADEGIIIITWAEFTANFFGYGFN